MSEYCPRWQPIETAPKDGTEILVFVGGTIIIGSWSNGSVLRDEGWYDAEAGVKFVNGLLDPTHWQPLPSPPREPVDKITT